jgi:hypothetical protein
LIVIRLAILLSLAGIALSLFLYLLQRDRRYLRLAWQILKFSAVLILVFATLVAIGRMVLFRMPL